ncbi:hypothetical protein [Aestuariispira insulae]|uniref:Putative enzyme related to lactoylglutathione lyase n=1 Tax=Aestuariispira insulae TaxID=1461337 RepID=A0A3D9HZ13_9PROT|nr:hypothetical protein [Aestuariispira insulae]RED54146.1 putative enzyme related to lactoylglutathione lyase [Aestuariispira insulae]
MSSKSTRPEWEISGDDYGRSLRGFGINLLVSDIERTIAFCEQVLQAHTRYWNEDIAIFQASGFEWMVHADHTYGDHPLSGFVKDLDGRGAGIELRLYDRAPDHAEAIARDRGDIILAGSMDKPHGMRECFILDPDGYCWVPSQPIG